MMRLAFGSNLAAVGAPPMDAADLARAEMRLFDSLEPQVRQAFANSLYGVSVIETVHQVRRYGANDQVKRALKDKGLMPCDVGTEGVIVETIRLADAAESARIKAALA